MSSKSQSPILSYFRNHSYAGKAVGVFTLVVVLLMGVIMPTYRKMKEVKSTLEKKSKDLNELQTKVVTLQSLDEEILAKRVEVIDGILPPDKNVVAYLATVDGLSRDLNLSLGGISLAPGEVYESTESAKKSKERQSARMLGLMTLETEIKIIGQEEQMYEFLRQIEGTAPLMQVRDVQMVRMGETENFALTLRVAMVYSAPTESNLKGVVSLLNDKEKDLLEEIETYKKYTIPGFDTDEGYTIEKKLNLFEPLTTAQDLALPSQQSLTLPEEPLTLQVPVQGSEELQ